MYKIYLAVGNEGVENYIKSQKPLLEKMLNNDTVNFVGATVYKEGALQGVKDYHPDVIILREGLQGSLDILDLIYKIRLESSNTRIIFITKTRQTGDALLAESVHLGVYDLIVGDKISVKDLLKKIVYPNKFVDVAHFVPRITVDEKTNKRIFAAPDVDALVKQRVEEILHAQELAREAEAEAARLAAEQASTEEVKPIDEPRLNLLKDSENTKIEVVERKSDEPELVAEYTYPDIDIDIPEINNVMPNMNAKEPEIPQQEAKPELGNRAQIHMPTKSTDETSEKKTFWQQMKQKRSK